MLRNVSREHLCFELRHQSRRATNTDAILVTEEGEEVAVHQAVLGLHSRLLKTHLLQSSGSCESPKLILCGVSKTMLDAFISLLYCGEASLERTDTESLIELLRVLDVDTRHLSFPGFLVQSRTDSHIKGKERIPHDFRDVKEEIDSVGDKEEDFTNAYLDEDCGDDINDLEEEKRSSDKRSAEKYEPKFPDKISRKWEKMGGLRKKDWKKKMEEEIQQGKRYSNGNKKVPQYPKKREIPQKARKGKFMCPECGNIFTMQKTLKKHIEAIHQGIRYPCDQCPFQGRTKMTLKYHIESVHEGKRYYCDQCEFIALTKDNLKTHVKYKHCEKNYHCDQCDYKTKTAAILQVHINAIHLKIKLTCPDCGSKHSQQGGLIKHRKLKHGYKPEERITNRRLAMAFQT